MSVTKELIEKAYSYTEYRELINRLLAEDKTTGDNHSESMLDYTRLNQTRMNRVEKTFKLNDDLAQVLAGLKEEVYWVTLTEAWCGDAAQNIPTLAKVAEASAGKVTLKLLLRDENLPLMDQYLTNGGRSIPKLIVVRKDDLSVVGTWGPRPEPVQQKMKEAKEDPNFNKEVVTQEIQLWYARDRGKTLQSEFAALLSEITALA